MPPKRPLCVDGCQDVGEMLRRKIQMKGIPFTSITVYTKINDVMEVYLNSASLYYLKKTTITF